MPKVMKKIQINAPIREVFTYLDNPRNELEWMQGMVDVRDVHGSGKNTHFSWTFKMGGHRLEGETERVEEEADHKIVERLSGEAPSTWTFTLEPQGESTELNLDVEYTIPHRVLSRLTEPMVMKRHEREIEQDLLNIKERMEHMGGS